MHPSLLAFLSFLPILTVAVLLVALRWPASRAMPICYGLVAALALFIWRVPAAQVAAASINGLMITVTLLYIIFGAMLLLNTLRESGGLRVIRQGFTDISPDRRVQVIIVAWLFGSFIEGSAGFGAPAAVAVPLLVGLGFPAMAAVLSGMIIQSTPVSFGAVGTPIKVGIGNGLEIDTSPAGEATHKLSTDGGVEEYATAAGLENGEELLAAIGLKVATLHAFTGLLVPLLLCGLLTRFYGPRKSFLEGLRIWKFALFAALAMIVPYWLAAWLLGPEYPSLIGSLIGLFIVIATARSGFLIPSPEKAWDFAPRDQWSPDWMGSLQISSDDEARSGQSVGILHAWLPYVLVGLLLVLTRTIGDLEAWLKGWHITVHSPLEGTLGPKRFEFLYLPGAVFILVSVVTFFLHRMDWRSYKRSWSSSFKTTAAASIALVFTVPMVQIFIHSDGGGAGYSKMPEALATGVASLAGGIWPILSTFIGGLGAFVAGSNTMSNMMLSLFQFNTGQEIGVNPTWIVALQAVGGAAGNMICVHNVVAASAVAGLVGKEGTVIRKTVWGFLYYALFAGSLGYAIVSWNEHGLFNIGTLIVAMIWATAIALIILSGRRRHRVRTAPAPSDPGKSILPAEEREVQVASTRESGETRPSDLPGQAEEPGNQAPIEEESDSEPESRTEEDGVLDEEMDSDKWLARREALRKEEKPPHNSSDSPD
ncbi:MAG: L-lactate permease [Verrucomicrobiota bacterium]|nr:L-lactate permease [Verrucomicrobiota bacterium]